MIPFSVKQAWFWLALVGLVQCWIMLLVLPGRKYGGLWGRLYYCLFVTLLEGIFSLGMIWHMDPKRMPHTFCIAQVVSLSLGAFALTGVCASFTVANALAVFRPQSFDSGRAILAWNPRYIPLVILFPLFASALYTSLLIKLNAVQPALVDDLHCEITNPMWMRLLGYAGVPLTLTLPFLCLSITTAVRLIRLARSRGLKRRSADETERYGGVYDCEVRSDRIARQGGWSRDDTVCSQSYEMRINSLSYSSPSPYPSSVGYTGNNAITKPPRSRSHRLSAFLPYPTFPFLNRSSTVGPCKPVEPDFTFVNVPGHGGRDGKEEQADPFPLHRHPFPPGALTSSTDTGSQGYIDGYSGSEDSARAFSDGDNKAKLDHTLTRSDIDEAHDHAHIRNRTRADSAISSLMPVFAPNPQVLRDAPGSRSGPNQGTRTRSTSNVGFGSGTSGSGAGSGFMSDVGHGAPPDASLGNPGGYIQPTVNEDGSGRANTNTNTTCQGDVQLGWAVTTDDAGLHGVGFDDVAATGLEDEDELSPIGLALTTDEPSLRHTPSPAVYVDPTTATYPDSAVAAFPEHYGTSPGVGSSVSFPSPEPEPDTEPESAATPTSASPMLRRQEQQRQHILSPSINSVISRPIPLRLQTSTRATRAQAASTDAELRPRQRTPSMNTLAANGTKASKDTEELSHKLSREGHREGQTSVDIVFASSSTTLHADGGAVIRASTGTGAGRGAEKVDYDGVRLKLDTLNRNDGEDDYDEKHDPDGDHGSDIAYAKDYEEDILHDTAFPFPHRRPIRTHTRALNPHLGVPLSLPLANDGVYNPTPPPWTASSTGVSDLRAGERPHRKRGRDEESGMGLSEERGWKGLFWRDEKSVWGRERAREKLESGERRETRRRKEIRSDRKYREHGEREARRVWRWERRNRDQVRGSGDGFEAEVSGVGGGGTGNVANGNGGSGTGRRSERGLRVAIWRMVLFQICFFTVQLLASLTPIIDIARGTITPFGTQHFALLLAAWGPLFVFCQVPQTWRFWTRWM